MLSAQLAPSACGEVIVFVLALGLGVLELSPAEADGIDCTSAEYRYCEDFEEGASRDGQARAFSIVARSGVREGAGRDSRYGYSTVLIENDGIPPFPRWRIPRQEGTFFVQYDLKAPANFFLGRADHGYYLYDSTAANQGRTAVDHATDHPAWLDPEWDPLTIPMVRSPGYGSEARSFEGFEPKRRGEWHTHQMMVIPSPKDSAIGRIKLWIDGELAISAKMPTLPAYDTFWLSNYWHSLLYVPQDQGYGNLHEKHTAPPHPAFEILLDNFVISRSFIELGPGRPQIERVRFADLRPDGFAMHFDTTVAAKSVAIEWGTSEAYGNVIKEDGRTPGYFHSLRVAGLAPGTTYHVRARATDGKGREVVSPDTMFTTPKGGRGFPDFVVPNWKGEVYGNPDFEGTPALVRSFASLAFVSWPGADRDEIVNAAQSMAVRYTRKGRYEGGRYRCAVTAWDGVRVLVDGRVKVDAMRATRGRNPRHDFALDLSAGEHTVVVEHGIWRANDSEQWYSKYLAFDLRPETATPPVCYSRGVYSSRFYKPEEPRVASRWSTECDVTVDYGETTAYGRSVSARGRHPMVSLGRLEIGKTYHYRLTGVDLMGNEAVLPDATFVCGDSIPPNKTLVSLARTAGGHGELLFTSPGEDSNFGTAASYDVRWSSQPLNVTNWDQATRVAGLPRPQPANRKERIALPGLPVRPPVYVALQAVDAAGNRSLLSNVVSDPPGAEIMDCDGDGFGVGALEGPDPDDYDPRVPARRE